MYVIYSGVRFVKISPPNECDKILKITNKQTEPTDYTANCSTDSVSTVSDQDLPVAKWLERDSTWLVRVKGSSRES